MSDLQRLAPRYVLFVVASLAMTTIAACGDTAPIHPDVVVTAAPANRADTAVAVGNVTKINVTVQNRGSGPHTISSGFCPPAFEVQSATGRVISPQARDCLAVAIMKTLQAGEKWVISGQWVVDGTHATR